MLEKHYYFAYGSNMNSARMKERGLAFTDSLKGVMKGYRLAFNKKAWDHPARSYANIVYDPASLVEGVLYELTDEHQIQLMDPFEGAPRLYSRDIFSIETTKGAIHSWVYVANKAMIADGLKPDRWYLDHLLEGKSLLSPEYYQALTQVETNG